MAPGKLGQLGLLLELHREVAILREVYNQVVVSGTRLGAPEAQAVGYLVQQHIRVIDVSASSSSPPAWAEAIDAGEVQAILPWHWPIQPPSLPPVKKGSG